MADMMLSADTSLLRTDAWSWRAQQLREQAACLSLALDEEKLALRDV